MNKTDSLYQILPVLLAFTVLTSSCKKPDPVLANFTTDPTEVFAGETVQFTNASENANFYQWDFGDGSSSILENPTHVYDSEGTYKVILTAIGDEDSNTASREIIVFQSYDVSIYEGVGIEGASLSDSWSDIQSVFNTDTAYFREYLVDFEIYRHIAYYQNDGVAFVFFNEDSLLHNEDPLYFIYIFPPYAGSTTKGIGIGSTMPRVIEIYGQPESIDEGDGFEGYWYDTQGVDFYSYDSGLVDEIDIYSIAATKSASLKKPLIEYLKKNRKFSVPR